MASSKSKKDVSAMVSGLGMLMTIIQALIELIRSRGGSEQDFYRLATPDGKSLLEKIADLIVEAGRVAKNNASSMFTALFEAAGIGERFDERITEANFPKGTGKLGAPVTIEHFGKWMTTKQVIDALAARGLRPATLFELLDWAALNRELKLTHYVVALGSAVALGGVSWFPVLCFGGGGRDLGLDAHVNVWDAHYAFAAVPASNK